jgi:hypothetical protein
MMLNTSSRKLGFLITAWLLTMTGACARTEQPEQLPSMTELRQLLSYDNSRPLIASAETNLARCMKRSGFSYIPVDPVAAGREAFEGPLDGVDNRQFRLRHGYGISEAMSRIRETTDPNRNHFLTLSSEERDKYVEIFGGCRSISYEMYEKRATLVADLFFDYKKAVNPALHPKLREFDLAWSTCVKRKGFDATYPDDLKAQVSALVLGGKEALRFELSAALADFDCESLQASSRRTVIAQIEAKFNESHRADVLRVTQMT